MLVDAEDIAGGVAEVCGDLAGVASDGLYDLSSQGGDCIAGGGDAVDHDVDEEARGGGGRPLEGPGAADLADGVVEGEAAVAAVPKAPAEGLPVEGRGEGDVEGRDFDGADFAV